VVGNAHCNSSSNLAANFLSVSRSGPLSDKLSHLKNAWFVAIWIRWVHIGTVLGDVDHGKELKSNLWAGKVMARLPITC